MLRPVTAKNIDSGHRGCDRRTTSHIQIHVASETKIVVSKRGSNTPLAKGTLNENIGIGMAQNCCSDVGQNCGRQQL